MTRPSEDDLIARHFRPLATDPGAFQLRDDCAVLTPPPSHQLVLKTDAVAEGVHFFSDDVWRGVAQKALRVNLSDLAAKGAKPLGYLLSLALPSDWHEEALADFAAGLALDQEAFDIALLGGDTIRSPKGLVITITVIGSVPMGRMVRRGGAQPGDALYVSGTIGDSALGLQLRLDPTLGRRAQLSDADNAFLIGRYLLPRPRLSLAPALLAHASGGMDISDGLVLDATRMAGAAGVDLDLDVDAIPLSAAARNLVEADPAMWTTVLTGGDDYELLISVAADRASDLELAANAVGSPVTLIGRATAGRGEVRLHDAAGSPIDLAQGGYTHF